jgi:hypothetical protein
MTLSIRCDAAFFISSGFPAFEANCLDVLNNRASDLVCGDRSGVCSDSSFGAGFDPLCALVFPALDGASVA